VGNPLEDWVIDVCGVLGLDPALLDRDTVLDLARDAAHGVARPAAPLTTFLVGVAAGKQGGDASAVRDAAAKVDQLLATRGPTNPS
jgi:hypothetical protein